MYIWLDASCCVDLVQSIYSGKRPLQLHIFEVEYNCGWSQDHKCVNIWKTEFYSPAIDISVYLVHSVFGYHICYYVPLVLCVARYIAINRMSGTNLYVHNWKVAYVWYVDMFDLYDMYFCMNMYMWL